MIPALSLVSSALSSLSSTNSAAATSATKAASGGDFASVMSKLTSDAVQNVKSAETLSVDGVQGKANTQEVVQAVMSAQESLQTALAIRDKAVAAFQEMTKMAI